MEGPSFYLVLMDLSSQLGLPQGFTEKYQEIVPRDAKLRIASGATWEVSVKKVNDSYFFTKGWTEFQQQMGLQKLDLLVFSYAGNSTFHVTVYSVDAYEKDSNFQEFNSHV